MEKVNAFLKRKNIVFSAKRYGIDALGAMAQGLFCSLLIGTILNDGYTSLRTNPALVIAAGIPLVIATLGFTFLGESLRDALDPKLKSRLSP